SVQGKTIAVLGLAFKPNTDDMRDAPSLDIIATLKESGAEIRVYDPESMGEARKVMPEGLIWCDSAYETMGGAEALVIITEWNQFRSLDFEKVKALLKSPVLVDLRNIYDPDDMAAAGFHYTCVGRPFRSPVAK
ncbi:MAG: UDP-glucose dehydrogenase, partial [Proteobacteria bacterium]|nr:UDP-glucose dehydrogenase [Pseudomonadota bacterium]